MKIQHIISTMSRNDIGFLEFIKCKKNVLIINQADRNDLFFKSEDGIEVRMISNTERGLSNSRNALLDNAVGDVCIIGDDDIVYVEGYEKIIKEAYEEYPLADIICFRFALDSNLTPRPHFASACGIDIFKISKVASVEVTFKLKSIKEKGIRFDTLLGVGSTFGSGEENAFLADALRAGLKIQYVPETICYLQPTPEDRVKWKNGFDKDYFIKRGACFYRIYKRAFLPFTLAFLLLKKRNLFKDVNIFKAFFWMTEGKKEYKKLKKEF